MRRTLDCLGTIVGNPFLEKALPHTSVIIRGFERINSGFGVLLEIELVL